MPRATAGSTMLIQTTTPVTSEGAQTDKQTNRPTYWGGTDVTPRHTKNFNNPDYGSQQKKIWENLRLQALGKI